MKESISRLARGIVDTESPRLALLQPNIDEVIGYGRIHQGDFRVSSENRLAFRGLVYSSDSRVTLKNGYFTGEKALISYEVDARHLEEGEAISGAFTLVSNGGEYTIPYCFRVQVAEASRFGQLRTIQQFGEMVQAEPDTALRLFESEEFARLPFMQDMPVQAVYQGLRRGSSRRGALEEFLVAAGAKEGVRLTADTGERHYVGDGEEQTDCLTLSRNTWGYLACRIRTDARFLAVEKESVTDSDFVGNSCEVRIHILPRFLHTGHNYGKITVESAYSRLEIPVAVHVPMEEERQERHLRFRRNQVAYIRADLDRLAGRYETDLLLNRMETAWEAMAELREPDVRRKLWQIELAMHRGRKELAGRLMNELQPEVQKNRLVDVDSYCYFLYLQMRLIDSWELRERLLKLLEKYQERGQGTPLVAFLQMQVDESLRNRPAESLERMREFYRKGLRSPYLYLEACLLYNQVPDVIQKLNRFTLQALWFGSRHGYLTPAVAEQVAGLSVSETGFRPELYRVLQAFYQAFPSKALLHAICAILIRGGQRGKEWFPWFAKGVEADVRLTRLYDYYLYTLPEDFEGPLPQVVLLYYTYNSPADASSQLRLYRNVLENFDLDSKMGQAYEKQIQPFALEQLLAGNIDDSLAVLYGKLLYPEMVDGRMARILPDILQTRRIQVKTPGMSQVVVVYGELEGEKAVPIRGGIAYVPVYTEGCRLLFMDAGGGRFAGAEYTCEPLFPDRQELLERCREIWPEHPMLKLARCNGILQKGAGTEEEAALLRNQWEAEGLRPLYRRRLTAGVIRCYARQDMESGDELLACVENPYVSQEDRLYLTEALIEREYLAEAFRLVRVYGYEKIRVPLLLKLCSRTIQNQSYQKEEFLLELAYYLFQRGQDNDTVLTYLCLHYNGLSRDMLVLLRRGEGRKLDTGDLAERLLAQELFSRTYCSLDEVFQLYLEKGAPERLLANAYFVVKCYGYFMQDEKVEDSVFRHIREIAQTELLAGSVPVVCLLALTKYYAGQPELPEEDAKLCQEMLLRLYHRGMVFPYFKKLGRLFPLPDELRDKTILEYRGDAAAQAELWYRILPEGEGKPLVRTEMPQSYPGIFVKMLLLFSGDDLEYEIWTIQGKRRELAERGRRKADVPMPGSNRFQELNALTEGLADPEDASWQQAVQAYAEKDALVESLFPIL